MSSPTGFSPAAEVGNDGDDAVIRLELPGVDVDKDVTIELDAGHPVIHGERRDEHTTDDPAQDGRTLREVRYGTRHVPGARLSGLVRGTPHADVICLTCGSGRG